MVTRRAAAPVGDLWLPIAAGVCLYAITYLTLLYNIQEWRQGIDSAATELRRVARFASVGSAQQTRIVVPYLFIGTERVVGTRLLAAPILESVSFLLCSLGAVMTLRAHGAASDRTISRALPWITLVGFWNLQQGSRIGDLFGVAFLLIALGVRSQRWSLIWLVLLAAQRLDLAVTFVIVAFLMTRKGIRDNDGAWRSWPFVWVAAMIVLAYGLVVVLWLPPHTGVADNPGLYYPGGYGWHGLKLAQLIARPGYCLFLGVTIALFVAAYYRGTGCQGIRSAALMAGAVIAGAMALAMGYWSEVRIFQPSVLLFVSGFDHSDRFS